MFSSTKGFVWCRKTGVSNVFSWMVRKNAGGLSSIPRSERGKVWSIGSNNNISDRSEAKGTSILSDRQLGWAVANLVAYPQYNVLISYPNSYLHVFFPKWRHSSALNFQSNVYKNYVFLQSKVVGVFEAHHMVSGFSLLFLANPTDIQKIDIVR